MLLISRISLLSLCSFFVFAVTPVSAAAPVGVVIDGPWQGAIVIDGSSDGGATASLHQSGMGVSGTVALATSASSETLSVSGRERGARMGLRGRTDTVRFRWHGDWSAASQGWSGPFQLRTTTGRVRGELALVQPGGTFSPDCGALDSFANEVMPIVLEPICSRCHVAGGLAEAARLRVTVGDPVATMLSALPLVDVADPALSRLLQKPRAEVSHGGGLQILSGSIEDQVLTRWVELAATPACSSGNPGGPTTPEGLYADNCASCHGSDARGSGGRPDIHCNRSIFTTVRSGRGGDSEDMPAFPDLADAEIESIQSYLIGLCPSETVSGAELFVSNCATCHGADGGGSGDRPAIRCATRTTNAVRLGRGEVMPAFDTSGLPDSELALLVAELDDMCRASGRSAADLYSGNCSTCHGATAGGRVSALGVRGPNIRCTELGDYLEKVSRGDGAMPSFPALSRADAGAIRAWVFADFCTNP